MLGGRAWKLTQHAHENPASSILIVGIGYDIYSVSAFTGLVNLIADPNFPLGYVINCPKSVNTVVPMFAT
jgi:hypothetical protein